MDESVYEIVMVDGQPHLILRVADQTYIPFDDGNSDYQAYKAWVAEQAGANS